MEGRRQTSLRGRLDEMHTADILLQNAAPRVTRVVPGRRLGDGGRYKVKNNLILPRCLTRYT